MTAHDVIPERSRAVIDRPYNEELARDYRKKDDYRFLKRG
jgi:hypothetical protein